MGRKKKDDDLLSTSVSHAYADLEKAYTQIYEPEFIDTTGLDDTTSRTYIARPPYIVTTDSTDSPFVYTPSITSWPDYSLGTTTLRAISLEDLEKQAEKEAMKEVEIIAKPSEVKGEHIVICKNSKDLELNSVLKALSAIKGRLMLDIAPIQVKKIECRMTPSVRNNIVKASKKLSMYSKTRPIVARFDEYGRRLPDEIELGVANGVALMIVDPKEYGEFYLELKATEFPLSKGGVVTEKSPDYMTYIDDDLPF